MQRAGWVPERSGEEVGLGRLAVQRAGGWVPEWYGEGVGLGAWWATEHYRAVAGEVGG